MYIHIHILTCVYTYLRLLLVLSCLFNLLIVFSFGYTSSPFFSASDKTHETLGSPAQGSVDSEPAAPLHVTRQTDEVPRRRYECSNYEICLGLAASLNWESFTCRGCSGATNQNLLWRARLTARKDTVAAKLLRAEPITPLTSPTPSAKRHSSVSVP